MFESNTHIDVDILVNGKPIKKYSYQDRIFIQSNLQTEYTIRVKNKTGIKRLAVVSVDGINVFDGQPAGTSQTGYILNPFDTLHIRGYRTDESSVNAFKFSSKERSYAKNAYQTMGDTSNCGVIGIEIYDEKPPRICSSIIPMHLMEPTRTTIDNMYEVTSTCCNQMKSPLRPNFDMGTEFSDKKVLDPITWVTFEIGSKVFSYSIFYASRRSLIKMGVPLVKETQAFFPQAFPTSFCRPPRKS